MIIPDNLDFFPLQYIKEQVNVRSNLKLKQKGRANKKHYALTLMGTVNRKRTDQVKIRCKEVKCGTTLK